MLPRIAPADHLQPGDAPPQRGTGIEGATLADDGDAPGPGGRLVIIQGFGEATGVRGGADERDVTVKGASAILSREPDNGELVLVWRLGSDGMGLIASESDFSAAELIRFAEGFRAP
jgi:hypothetical protein